MKYGVLGTGMVGHTLAVKLVSLRHEVCMGGRTVGNEKAAEWARKHDARSDTFRGASAWAERVIIDVNGAKIADVSDAVGNQVIAGKTVIDVTKPLDTSQGMPPTLVPELSNTTSAAETLQSALPNAHVVKILNTMNHQIMVDPRRVPGDHDVFLCGDNDEAKAGAREMLSDFGWKDRLIWGRSPLREGWKD